MSEPYEFPASAEDITIAKVVLAGWRLVEMEVGVHVGTPIPSKTIYVIYDAKGLTRGSKITRYTAALRALALMHNDERGDGLLPD